MTKIKKYVNTLQILNILSIADINHRQVESFIPEEKIDKKRSAGRFAQTTPLPAFSAVTNLKPQQSIGTRA